MSAESTRVWPSLPAAPGRYAGSHPATTVSTAITPNAPRAVRRLRPRNAAPRNRSSGTTSVVARRASLPLSCARSVQEGAVDTGTFLTAHVVGRHLRDRRTSPEHDRVLARLDRQLAQVGGDQDRGSPRPGVADHVHGRLDAERVHAVERLVEEQ